MALGRDLRPAECPVLGSARCSTPDPHHRLGADPMNIVSVTPMQAQVLRERLAARSVREGNCLVWTGCRSHFGHGTITFLNKKWWAHRASYLAEYGSIPKDKFICHRCDNPPCIYPVHLFVGTQRDNMQDAAMKGRLKMCFTSKQDHHKAFGESVCGAKLTEEQALAILRNHVRGTNKKGLADQYGVTESTIRRVIAGDTWKHLHAPRA